LKITETITFRPTLDHISTIKEWLLTEEKLHKQGFYCNWNVIEKAFNANQMGVYLLNGIPLAFSIYKTYEKIGGIDITETHYEYRNRGIGKKMILATYEKMKELEVMVSSGFCAPKSSYGFWKKIGALDFPTELKSNKLEMYFLLQETLKHSEKKNKDGNFIYLWNCKDHLSDQYSPKWKWNLDFHSDSLVLTKPIIFPVDKEWVIEIYLEGVLKYQGLIKRMCNRYYLYSDFLVIEDLNCLVENK